MSQGVSQGMSPHVSPKTSPPFAKRILPVQAPKSVMIDNRLTAGINRPTSHVAGLFKDVWPFSRLLCQGPSHRKELFFGVKKLFRTPICTLRVVFVCFCVNLSWLSTLSSSMWVFR